MAIQLILLKPDCVESKHSAQVINSFLAYGYKLTYIKPILLTNLRVSRLYASMMGMPFYNDMVTYLISGYSILTLFDDESSNKSASEIKGNTYRSTGLRGLLIPRDSEGRFVYAYEHNGKIYVYRNMIHLSDPGKSSEEFEILTN